MEANNIKKMHKAATLIRRDIDELRKSGAAIKKETNEVLDMIDDLAVEILSTPLRNCDRDLSDRQSIFKEFREWVNASSLGCASEPSASDAFRWLLAPATEKGATNGSK